MYKVEKAQKEGKLDSSSLTYHQQSSEVLPAFGHKY